MEQTNEIRTIPHTVNCPAEMAPARFCTCGAHLLGRLKAVIVPAMRPSDAGPEGADYHRGAVQMQIILLKLVAEWFGHPALWPRLEAAARAAGLLAPDVTVRSTDDPNKETLR